MSAVLYKQPPRAVDLLGTLLPGASLTFYAYGTDDKLAAYADPELTTKLPNPVRANSAARFPAFYFPADVLYRAVLTFEDVEQWDLDPLEEFPGTDSLTVLDDAGEPMAEAVRTFWLSRTTELAPIYDDETLTTPLDNPLTADENGDFPEVYLDDTYQYRTRLQDGDGRLIFDTDSYLLTIPQIVLPPGAAVLSGEIVDVEGDVQVDLDWTAATAGTFLIDYYEVYRSVDGAAFVLLDTVDAADPLHLDDDGLDFDTTYDYFVLAYDINGNVGPQSNTVELFLSESVYPVSGWINPGAELTNTTGWTETTGNMITMGPNERFPPVGEWIFRGGASPSVKMFQRFTIASQTDVDLADVDAGDATLVIDWWGGTFIQTPADQPAVNWRFRDAGLVELGSGTSGYKDPATQYGTNIRWDPYQEVAAVPPNTRYIDIELEAKRNNGTNNDAAFDEIVPHIEVNP